MHVILGKSLERRTFLRGLGAAVALPFLDAMVPAFAATPKPARRLGVVYVPNGMNMTEWRPSAFGANFELPRTLKPLVSFKNRMVVFSGMANAEADPLPGEGLGDHSRAQAVFLTGAHPRKTEGTDIRASISADQIIANKIGHETRFASLELGMDDSRQAGDWPPRSAWRGLASSP